MFVVFEGIDGSGKTTISNRVAERLRSHGHNITHLREGGRFASAVSEAIRDLGRDARNLDLVAQAEFLLYVARDVQLIEQVLRPALRQGNLVLADRFLYTAEVLGLHGRHLPDSYTRPILQTAAGGLAPDLVILVDVDPALARARRKAAKLAVADQRPPSRKGLSGVGLQQRLRRGYLELAASQPERWVVVDNEDTLEDVVARVAELIEDARQQAVAPAMARFCSWARGRAAAVDKRQVVGSPAEALRAFLRRVDARAEGEPNVAAYLLGGLFGAEIDPRRQALAARVPKAVLAGMIGLGDATSWALRESLHAQHPGPVASTLTGLPTDARIAALRAALQDEAPAEVALSLQTLDDDAAWEIRDRLYDRAADAVAGSLAGLASERAWQLRQRWLDQVGTELGQHYPVAQVGARSIMGLDDQRAWQVRGRARAVAPIAALASLAGVMAAQGWQWRQEFLLRAPKTVMTTLETLRDPRAWEMRRAVAPDCKEALDSIVGMDDAEAWELRDAYCDIWPSTVVKTLGTLGSTRRGQALIARQLAAYPGNLSLLKHAAAQSVALKT